MNKKESEALTNEMLVADTLLRLRAIENILIAKGLFTKEEFLKEMETLTRQIAKSILEKAGVPGELDELIDSLQNSTKSKSGN